MNGSPCSVQDCMAPSVAHGLCWKHYGRKRRHGNVEFVKRRYNMPHQCRYCGTTRPRLFYRFYKNVCKNCRKLRMIQRHMAIGKRPPKE